MWLPTAWAAALTGVILWPVLSAPGYALSYDMVFVPDQSLKPWMWGAGDAPPRAVPQDVYVALLDDVAPGWLLQRILLVAALLGAGVGIACLTAPLGVTGQLVAISCSVWSAYVLERLVIGHWGLLLACAALPWVLLLAARARAGSRSAGGGLVLLTLAATWVPTGGVLLCAVTLAVLLWPGAPRRWAVMAGVLMTQVTWLVPALLADAPAQPAGSAFGLRGEGGSGPLLTAVAGSGVWNRSVPPDSRSGPLAWVAAVAAVAVVLLGFRVLRRAVGRAVVLPLATIAVMGLGWAVLTGLPVAAPVVERVVALPGGGLLRDGQKWLAPWWLLVSGCAGAAAGRLVAARAGYARPAGVGLLLGLVPVLVLPDLALGAGGRLRAVEYPGDWAAVSAVLAEDPGQGAVVSVPWSAFRRYAWNGDRVVLDPAPRYLPGPVLASSDLLLRDGADVITLPGDDPVTAAVGRALAGSDPGAALGRLGVGWLLVQRDQPAGPTAPAGTALGAAAPVYSGQWLALYRLTGARPQSPVEPGFPWLVWIPVGATALVAGLAAARYRRDGTSAPMRC
jgi:hypothetical protein